MPDYLIHFNKNHDPKSGRFAPGDGNGDGVVGKKTKVTIVNGKNRKTYHVDSSSLVDDSYGDHGIQKDKAKTRRNAIIGTSLAATMTAGLAAMLIVDAVNTSRTKSGKMFADDYRRASAAKFVGGDW